MLKDDINLYNNTALFEKKCPSCEKNTHTLFKCPMINYIPSYYRIISKHTQSLCQTRKEFPRKIRIERKKYPNLKNLKIIQEKAEELTFQNPNYFIQSIVL